MELLKKNKKISTLYLFLYKLINNYTETNIGYMCNSDFFEYKLGNLF